MDHLKIERLVHLDLKGAPPKLNYLEEFFPFIKSIGATGILLEWEDTFPYSKELEPIGSLNSFTESHYSTQEASRILDLAKESDLTVIPLVQTFGHMEFILKHDRWSNLREVSDYPSSMCPSKSEALPLIRSLINQIVSFHPHLQYIHIGGDEVWHMGFCATCKEKIQTNKYGKCSLYLDHITAVTQFINSTYPDLKIIVWDDMFRKIHENILQEYNIGNLVELMIWQYDSHMNFFNDPKLWEKYANFFPNIWGASAFKGATGSAQITPVVIHHIENQESWLRGLNIHKENIKNFRGIIFTGWSRYDHYATLCELLPCSVPSLCICLRIWLEGKYSQDLNKSVGNLLGYKNDFLNNATYQRIPSSETFSFPGSRVLVVMEWLVFYRNKYMNTVNGDQFQSWCNSWQISNNYTNPMQLDSILPVIKALLAEYAVLEENLKVNLDQIYYEHTVEEIIGTLLIPMKEHLIKLECDCALQRSKGCIVKPQST